MRKKNLIFGDFEIEKTNFYRHETPIFLKDVDIEKVLESNEIYCGGKHYKYFFVYLHNDEKVKPLHIMHPKTNAYVKSCDGQTKWMNFLLK